MIERWFPGAEVSANSDSGWGSGNQEIGLFPWFAKRPTAQAKAAVICSLLPWPDDPAEQDRLQELVRSAMTGRYAAWDALRAEIGREGADRRGVLDPFSGRGMIPLEAARLGVVAHAIDYSPVAVLGSTLLTDYPFRNWDEEPPLPFTTPSDQLYDGRPRLLKDVEAVFATIGGRWALALQDFYPPVEGRQPWGYLWAITLPCQECGGRFPLVGSYHLRRSSTRRGVSDPGQSFFVETDSSTKRFWTVVHDGPPRRAPTLTSATDASGRKIAGKSAICPFCHHVHPLSVHRRLTDEHKADDALLIVADHAEHIGKEYRPPTDEERAAAARASKALATTPAFGPLLPAVPDERIAPGNNNIIGPAIYGARTYGDFMCHRQTLSFVLLARTISDVGQEVRRAGASPEYARALSGYAAAVVARKLRRSTRGCTLDSRLQKIHDIYANQGSIGFSQDFFEAGIGDGPGTWESLSRNSFATLAGLLDGIRGRPVDVQRGTATQIALRDGSVAAVVTDPPYDQMLAYADSSDLIYSWLKRCLHTTWPELTITADPHGAQEKTDEIIVKRVRGEAPDEHRTREHYDAKIAQAFAEMRRVVSSDGIVAIVFGSGDPEVWQRLLTAIQQAGLVMTGSWPASTEAGSHQGKANIETTLTMACRPAPAGREPGRKGTVEREIKAEIKRRYPDWERWGLAPADMLMAAAGPAMEVVGRYSEVLDSRGEPVDIHTFLPLARSAVQDAMAVDIDHRPLDAFDARTRFALWWARLYGRQPQPKSELRWQVLASSMDLEAVRDLVGGDKGVALISSESYNGKITHDSAVIDVALALAAASTYGLAAMGEVLAASQFEADDQFLWAAIQFLADRLPDSDSDSVAFHRVLRARAGIGTATENVARAVRVERARQDIEDRQIKLL
jgi:putative DNA methylase